MDKIYQLQIGEKYDYNIDMSVRWPGDTIATVVWTIPTGLTESGESNTTTTATVWLERTGSGMLTVSANLTSASGRVEVVELLFIE